MNKDKKDNQEPMPVVNVTVEEPSPEPSSEAQPDASQADDVPSLQQLIRDNVTEEDTSFLKSNVSLKQILWGDFLTAEIVRRQIWLILLVVFFVIVYIAQRYSYQKYMLEIDKKTAILKDAKFKALSAKSELTERTRQSKILDMLKINNDSLLKISDRPPYYIKVPE